MIKPLAYNDMDQLQKVVDHIKSKIKVNTERQCRDFLKSADDIWCKGDNFHKNGDEEAAFIYFMRYLLIITTVRASFEFKKAKEKMKACINNKHIEIALITSEKLKENLKKRYEQAEKDINTKKEIEKQIQLDKTNSLKNKTKNENAQPQQPSDELILPEVPTTDFKLILPNLPSNRNSNTNIDNKTVWQNTNINNKASETNQEIDIEKDSAKYPTYTNMVIMDFYKFFREERHNIDSMLIIDTRPVDEFSQAHMSFNSLINIPNNILKPGANINTVDLKLLKNDWQKWDSRSDRQNVVIFDDEYTESSKGSGKTPAEVLLNILLKQKGEFKIILVYGGFEQWRLHFPSFTSNPTYSKKVKMVFVDPMEELKNLEYPTLPNWNKKNISSSNESTTTMLDINNEIPKAPIINNDVPKYPIYPNIKDIISKPVNQNPVDNTNMTIVNNKRNHGDIINKIDNPSEGNNWKPGFENNIPSNDDDLSKRLDSMRSAGTRLPHDLTNNKLLPNSSDELIRHNSNTNHNRTFKNDIDVRSNTTSQSRDVNNLVRPYQDGNQTPATKSHTNKIDVPQNLNQNIPNNISFTNQNENSVVPKLPIDPVAPKTTVSSDVSEIKSMPDLENSRQRSTTAAIPPKEKSDNKPIENHINSNLKHTTPTINATNDDKSASLKGGVVKTFPRDAVESSQVTTTKQPLVPNTNTQPPNQTLINSLPKNIPVTPSPVTPSPTPNNINRTTINSIQPNINSVPLTPQAKPITPQAPPITPQAKPITPQAKPITQQKNIAPLPSSQNRKALTPSDTLKPTPKKTTTKKHSKYRTTFGFPEGWEKAVDHDNGRIYYIDHNTCTTHWKPPAEMKEQFMQESIETTPKNFEEFPNKPAAKKVSFKEERPSLKRSLSSPNIKDLMEQQDKKEGTSTPLIDRSAKPKEEKRQVVDRSKKPLSAGRLHNLSPVYGNTGRCLTGLKNLGNTCYMNSVLQCLSNTIPLAQYMHTGTYEINLNKRNMNPRPTEVAREMAFVFTVLYSGQYRSISPIDFKLALGRFSEQFSGYEQQDSHELLMFLLDGLHEDVNKVKSHQAIKERDNDQLTDQAAADLAWQDYRLNNDSVIVDLFQGQFRSTVICLSCRKKSKTFDAFNCLQLGLPNNQSTSLERCIESFTKSEKIGGNDSWRCSSCKCYREASKTIEIWKLPPVLIVQLKRFRFDGRWHNKIQTGVNFPLDNFNLSSFIVAPTSKFSNYRLYAVINHYGSFDSGHYTAYAENSYTNKWYSYDDNHVKEINKNSIKSNAAYLLFYTAVNFKDYAKK